MRSEALDCGEGTTGGASHAEAMGDGDENMLRKRRSRRKRIVVATKDVGEHCESERLDRTQGKDPDAGEMHSAAFCVAEAGISPFLRHQESKEELDEGVGRIFSFSGDMEAGNSRFGGNRVGQTGSSRGARTVVIHAHEGAQYEPQYSRGPEGETKCLSTFFKKLTNVLLYPSSFVGQQNEDEPRYDNILQCLGLDDPTQPQSQTSMADALECIADQGNSILGPRLASTTGFDATEELLRRCRSTDSQFKRMRTT